MVLSTAAPIARADGPELASLATNLASEDANVRRDAIAAYTALDATSLPALDARLDVLRRRRPDPTRAAELLTAIRHAAGSRRADDAIDIAIGVEPFLTTTRDRDALAIVEPLLALRALEHIGTTDALRRVPSLLDLDGAAVWRAEGRRLLARCGDHCAAAGLLARSATGLEGRDWARFAGRQLELDDAGRLVQRLTAQELADVLAAWGRTRTMSALAVVASYVDSDRASVRRAARDGLSAYGQNAIWVARDQFRLRLGRDADSSWGWQRTLEALYGELDARRTETTREGLATARAALSAGDLAAGRAALSLASRGALEPELAQLELDLGTQALEQGDLALSEDALLRAIAVSDDPELRAAIDPRLAYVRAERALDEGYVDLAGFERAQSACEHCGAAYEDLSSQRISPRDQSPLYAGAGALFTVLALLLAWPRRRAAGTTVASDHAPSDPDVSWS